MNKVLLIDDDRDDFLLTKQLIEKEQQYVVIPTEYEEMGRAFDDDVQGTMIWNYTPKLLKENADEICVIICDLVFNGYESGLDLIARIRTDPQFYTSPDRLFNSLVPIIALTGYTDKDIQALRSGANYAIQKSDDPVQQKKLLETIKRQAIVYERMYKACTESMWPNELKDKIWDFKGKNAGINVFLMTSFDEKHKEFSGKVKSMINSLGPTCHVANAPGGLNTSLVWSDVAVYMNACDMGVAIFYDDYGEDNAVNPNVCVEVGYMKGRNKPVLILMERSLGTLPVDLNGLNRVVFDKDDSNKILMEVKQWIDNRVLDVHN